MEIVFSAQALKDRDYWIKTGNKAVMNKITALLKDMKEHPYTGIGKPEPLKYDLTGKWSRRITIEHWIVYAVQEKEMKKNGEDVKEMELHIFSMRYHYDKK